MGITHYEKLILEDLKRNRATIHKRQVLDLITALTGLVGLLFVVFIYPQVRLIIIIAGLCGGLIGVSIERLYNKKISTLAIKLYEQEKSK